MSNVRFLHDFKFDDATISSASEVSTLPDDNVVDPIPAKVWRSSTDTGQWLKFDLGSAMKITMLSIFEHNLTSGATITLEGNSADSWGSPAYSQAFTWNDKAIVLFLDQTYQWWRITFEDGSNPDTYIEIGRICAGEYIEPDVNINEAVGKRLIDPSIHDEEEGQFGYTITRPKYRMISAEFTGIARAQQDLLTTLFEAVGNTEPLVFALDPDYYPGDDTIYCKLNSSMDYALGALANGNVSLVFEEKTR